jgi:HEAT repeat protein
VATGTLAEAAESRSRWWSGLGSWSWFGKPVSALTLIALGFFGARVLPTEGGRTSQLGLAETGPVASRVRFVEPGESGRVQIVVEETRQRTLSGGMDDDGIRSLLLRAARESSDPGVRVETMDLLKGQPQSQDVRKALLHALRQDTNAGVRLKALEALRPSAGDSDVRQALAEALLKDDNPGVRTQAVDLLTQKREPELVGVLQELMTRENNDYVRMKCQRVLADMNASAESF